MGKGSWRSGADRRGTLKTIITQCVALIGTGFGLGCILAVWAVGDVWAEAVSAQSWLSGRVEQQEGEASGLPPLPALPTLPERTSTGKPLAEEARGTWVVRGRWLASEAAIDWIVLQHVLHNMNVIFAQVNGRGYAYYNSDIVPEADGVTPGFDPLAALVEKAHAAGIEVHAWINAYTVGAIGERPDSPEHVVNLHPEWITYDANGKSVLDYDWEDPLSDQIVAPTLDPGVPAVNDYVCGIYLEVVEKYDVDGIHFDYIRYPYRRFGYHPKARARFESEYGVDPAALRTRDDQLVGRREQQVTRLREAWDQWRRDRVTDLVRCVHRKAKAIRPAVKVSAAVIADIDQAVGARLQDWPAWLEQGIVDFVVPMAYSANPDTVHRQIAEAVARAGDRQVYAGIGAYKVSGNPDEVVELIDAARRAGSDGVVLFSFNWEATSFLFWGQLRHKAFPEPTRIPSMPWMEDSAH